MSSLSPRDEGLSDGISQTPSINNGTSKKFREVLDFALRKSSYKLDEEGRVVGKFQHTDFQRKSLYTTYSSDAAASTNRSSRSSPIRRLEDAQITNFRRTSWREAGASSGSSPRSRNKVEFSTRRDAEVNLHSSTVEREFSQGEIPSFSSGRDRLADEIRVTRLDTRRSASHRPDLVPRSEDRPPDSRSAARRSVTSLYDDDPTSDGTARTRTTQSTPREPPSAGAMAGIARDATRGREQVRHTAASQKQPPALLLRSAPLCSALLRSCSALLAPAPLCSLLLRSAPATRKR